MAVLSVDQAHPAEVQTEWRRYVDSIDQRILEALKRSMKNSLRDLSRALNGDTKTEVKPLFKLFAMLEGHHMDFNPTMNELKELLQNVCRDMTTTLTVMVRLPRHFRKEKVKDA
ncbi:hypothetical protein FOZ62_021535, partial [Perkinsus olseni]